MALAQLAAVLLLASTASAQVSLFCSVLGGTTYSWNPNFVSTVVVQTSFSAGGTYNPSMNCYFQITAEIPGRVIVRVDQNSIDNYGAAISIRSTALGGYLADWNRLTFSADKHGNFISSQNRLFISFTTNSASDRLGWATGVRLVLTFLRTNACPPGFSPITLANQNHCIGRPTVNGFQFGDAQRYCNLQRSNLLVSDQNNVSSVLAQAGATEVWIGMTAEPSGSYSSYRWINNIGVNSRQAAVTCTGNCKPGSTTHRCVYATNPNLLLQTQCSQKLQPLCYMPAGGTDTFYSGSPAVRASGALLGCAVALLWALMVR